TISCYWIPASIHCASRFSSRVWKTSSASIRLPPPRMLTSRKPSATSSRPTKPSRPRATDAMMLRDHLQASAADRTLSDPRTTIAVADLVTGTILGGRAGELAGRSVLIAMTDQLTTALAMFEIDGSAKRILLCPPDLRTEHLASVIADAEIDAVVCDDPSFWQ